MCCLFLLHKHYWDVLDAIVSIEAFLTGWELAQQQWVGNETELNSSVTSATVKPFVSGKNLIVNHRKKAAVPTKTRNVYGWVNSNKCGKVNATNQLAAQLMKMPLIRRVKSRNICDERLSKPRRNASAPIFCLSYSHCHCCITSIEREDLSNDEPSNTTWPKCEEDYNTRCGHDRYLYENRCRCRCSAGSMWDIFCIQSHSDVASHSPCP